MKKIFLLRRNITVIISFVYKRRFVPEGRAWERKNRLLKKWDISKERIIGYGVKDISGIS